jgi:hypothetical protein
MNNGEIVDKAKSDAMAIGFWMEQANKARRDGYLEAVKELDNFINEMNVYAPAGVWYDLIRKLRQMRFSADGMEDGDDL